MACAGLIIHSVVDITCLHTEYLALEAHFELVTKNMLRCGIRRMAGGENPRLQGRVELMRAAGRPNRPWRDAASPQPRCHRTNRLLYFENWSGREDSNLRPLG